MNDVTTQAATAAPVATIGQFRLHQKAAVVAKLQCQYLNGDTWVHCDGTGGIPVAQSGVLDPGNANPSVPDGALVSIYVFVVWGNDAQGNEIFRYQKGNTLTANYALTGTTLDNHLAYEGL